MLMIGAIIGDILGSQYEYSNSKGRELPFFNKNVSTFTDDTVLTVATANALTQPGMDFKSKYIEYFNGYSGQKANGPGVAPGFGGMFVRWAMGEDEDYAPYGSWGNGGAMRVSPVAWFGNSTEEVLMLARESSAVTHSHVEGIKGAQAIALATYMARTGSSPDEIYNEMMDRFEYRFCFTLDSLHEYYTFAETAHQSVPQAIMCALEANSYEETIRNVLYIGGDTDTIGAMAGAISEGLHGIPARFMKYLEPVRLYAPELYSQTMEFNDKYCTGSKSREEICDIPFYLAAYRKIKGLY